MKYNRYPKYKDSGVEWIGEIPEGWEVEPLKFHVRINERKLDDNTEDELEISYIDIGSVHAGGKIDDPEIMKFADAPSRARRIIKKNDTILSTVRTYLKAIAFVDEKNDEQICSTGFAVITPKKNIQSKFLYYLLSSQHYIDHVMANSVGVTYPAINSNDLGIFPILVLPFDKAQEISEFLDKQTKQIDELIAKSKAQITLLEEKKQATINQAITKGLDPSVPMKDSGVEWIGEIPEGWEILPLFTVCKDNKKKNIGNKVDNVLSLSYGKIKRRNIENNFGLLPASFETYQILDDGDIVLRLTDLQNDKRSLRVGLVREKGIITSAYTGLKVSNSINSGFLYNLLHFYDLEKIFYGLGSGVRQSMNFSDLKRFPLVIPSTKEESNEISEFLDKQTTQFDKLIAKSKAQITLLEEKRQALITATVTGKIDVRGTVA